jgi:Heterokaryon incompatibility protein (HET)
VSDSSGLSLGWLNTAYSGEQNAVGRPFVARLFTNDSQLVSRLYGFPSRLRLESKPVSPTHLVRILEDRTAEFILSLQNCQAEAVDYIALSYCWGVKVKEVNATTSTNLDTRPASFSSSELPATLQDAALVAHRLGITCLWIDCLCIYPDRY